jgi:paraquat-inducible protein A
LWLRVNFSPPIRRTLRTAVAWRVPLALAAAVPCLAAGVTLPILRTSKFLVFTQPFSILDGVSALLAEGDWLIAGIIAVFSIGFPLVKIGMLVVLWVRLYRGDRPSHRWVVRLQSIGKWSMLDVLVVALVIFGLKASAFADATPAFAIYPFLAAIALTAYAGRAMETEAAPVDR